MSVYIVVFLYLLISAAYSYKQNSEKGIFKFNYLVVCIVLILLFGLRYRIGGDSIRYEEAFQSMPNINELEIDVFSLVKYQPMWLILNSLVKTLGGSFLILQLIQSAFVNGVVLYIIQKKSNYKYICVILYYLLYYQYFTTEILRESIAVAIFMLSFDCLLKEKYLRYYLLTTIAVLFHVSAVILLVVPLFKLLERKKYNVIALSVIVLLSSALIWSLFQIAISRMTFFIDYLEQISDTYLDRENNIFGVISSFLFRVLPYILILGSINASKKDNTYENRLIIVSIIFVLTLAISCSPLSRFSNYYKVFALIVIVNFIGNCRIHYKKSVAILCLTLLLYNQFAFYFKDYSIYTGGGKEAHYYNLFIPYSSYLNPYEDTTRETIVWGQSNLK